MKPTFITNWEENGQPFTSTGNGPQTIKLLKRLARQEIQAEANQIGEPKGGGCTYSHRDSVAFGWWLKTIVRGKASRE